jgi:cytochrome c oxidase subunit 2
MGIIIFIYGIKVWTDRRTMPDDSEAYVVEVTGQKWAWSFRYPDGRTTAQDLYVPEGKKVKLRMNSQDVLHSFFIPHFRIKEDVVPSFYTYLWFQADKAGSYNIFCTEYCGDQHSGMLGKVHVLDPEIWLRFENNLPLDPNKRPLTPLENGEQLYVKRACEGCHSRDGSQVIGPTFKGLYGRSEIMADGTQITADENYIVESILYPNRKIVKGYPANQMPSFEGQLSEQDISDLITFIKTLE